MTKQEFLFKLRRELSGLPKKDIEERIEFYNEMIDDRMEEGLTEEEAVFGVGNVEDIVSQLTTDKSPKETKKSRRGLSVAEIVFLVLGSPIWLSLLIAVFSAFLSLYVSWWSVIASLWSVFLSFVACFIGGVLACVVFTVGGNGALGLAMLAVGFLCAGVSVFMFYGCKAATKGTLILTKKMAIWTKICFIKKEVA